MDDLISRQAATDALRKMQTYKLFSGDDMLLIDQAGAMTELMLLPPRTPIQELLDVTADRDYWKAQCHSYEVTINRLTESTYPTYPERKRGKWIYVSEETWKCDQCGEISCCSPNFCPDCGSYNGG